MLFYYILVLSLPLTQHWLLGAGNGGFTVAKAVGILCIPVALLHLLDKGRIRISIPRAVTVLAAYFVILMGSWVWHANETAWELSGLQNVVSLLLLLWITVVLVDSTERLHRVLLVAVTSVLVASVYVIRDWMANRGIAGYRPGGVAGDANYFALCAAAAVLLAVALLQGRPSRREKFFLAGCLAITMIAFSLAASRGGFVGLAVGFLLLTAQSAARWRKLAFLGLFVVPALILAPNPVIQRFLNPGSGDNAAVQAREITWSAGLRMVAAHPLAGVGLYRFRQLVLLYEDPSQIQVRTLAHNTYIEVAAEQGLPGLLLFVTALGMIAAGLRRAIHASRGAGHLLLSKGARGLQAALVSTVVCAFFVSAGWNRFFWFVFFLGAAAARVGQAEPAAAVEGPDEASLDAGESSEPVTASGLLASTC